MAGQLKIITAKTAATSYDILIGDSILATALAREEAVAPYRRAVLVSFNVYDLHKEYIDQHTTHLERQEIPGDMVKFIQDKEKEEIEIKIKQGKITKDKDKRFLNYSFFYAFALASNILKHQQGRAGKHRCTITGIPYKKGFDSWINPGFPQAAQTSSPGGILYQ